MKKTLMIQGMNCTHCEHRIENALMNLKVVKRAKSDHFQGICEIELKKPLSNDILKSVIFESGYQLIEVKE